MFSYQEVSGEVKTLARRWGALLITLLTVFVLVLIASYGISAWKEWKDARGAPLQVTLTGEGKVSAKPDVAKITATILTQKELLKDAQEENSRKSNVVVGYLKSQGIEEKDIKTVGYNIYPQYKYPQPCYSGVCSEQESVPRIIGYQVQNSYEVTVRDLAKASDLLAGVVGAGVNEVGGISFTIDQPEAVRAEARAKAIENAEGKAEELARELGKRVGRIISFSESSALLLPYERNAALGGGVSAAPSPAVEPGQNEVIIDVSITYEFK